MHNPVSPTTELWVVAGIQSLGSVKCSQQQSFYRNENSVLEASLSVSAASQGTAT